MRNDIMYNQAICTHRNYGIDILKFVAAIAVVVLHSGIFLKADSLRWIGETVNVSTRWAVASFFFISGFFFSQIEEKYKLYFIAKQVIKIIFIFYFACIFYCFFRNILTTSFLESFNATLKYAYYTLVTFHAEDMPGHLWFLVSLAEGLFYLYLFSFFPKKFIFSMTIVLLIVGSLGQHHDIYHKLLCVPLPSSTRNTVYFALPYICLGYLFPKYRRFFDGFNVFHLVVLSLCLIYLEFFLLKFNSSGRISLSDYYIATPLLCVALFRFFFSIKIEVSVNSIFMRLSSLIYMYIYILHPAVITLWSKLYMTNDLALLLIIMVTTTLISAIATLIHFTVKIAFPNFFRGDLGVS